MSQRQVPITVGVPQIQILDPVHANSITQAVDCPVPVPQVMTQQRHFPVLHAKTDEVVRQIPDVPVPQPVQKVEKLFPSAHRVQKIVEMLQIQFIDKVVNGERMMQRVRWTEVSHSLPSRSWKFLASSRKSSYCRGKQEKSSQKSVRAVTAMSVPGSLPRRESSKVDGQTLTRAACMLPRVRRPTRQAVSPKGGGAGHKWTTLESRRGNEHAKPGDTPSGTRRE